MTCAGVPQTRTWFDATDLQDGAELVFDLASSPEGLTWGTGPDACSALIPQRSSRLRIFPVEVIGSCSAMTMRRGYL